MLQEIIPPTNCPVCDSELRQTSSTELFCDNPSCEAKTHKRLVHFCKVLKIKGFGEKTLQQLPITDIKELYLLRAEDLQEYAGCSQAYSEKLIAELEYSKSADLAKLLEAFAIPMVGKGTSVKLAAEVDDIFQLDKEACKRAGLGPKATESVINWLDQEFHGQQLYDLPFTFNSSTSKVQERLGVVCISGKLVSYKTKADATKALEAAGYVVKPSLTKEVTILVNESGIESAKTKSAREKGIQIVNNLTEILGDTNE